MRRNQILQLAEPNRSKMSLSPKSRVCLLYKTILRLHKGLPVELQSLGNNYARDEFKRHKNCNEGEAKIFMVEWTNYAVQLSQQLGLGVKGKPSAKIGNNLQMEDLEHFKEDQIVQLYELMKATTLADEERESESMATKNAEKSNTNHAESSDAKKKT